MFLKKLSVVLHWGGGGEVGEGGRGRGVLQDNLALLTELMI